MQPDKVSPGTFFKHLMFISESIELIPGLPEEIALECLTRLHFSTHGVAARVCHRWRELLHSKDFYYHRKKTGHTRIAACLVQSLPVRSVSDETKPDGPPAYGVSLFDPMSGIWDRIYPVPKYPNGLPLFCQVTSSEGKLVVMGGWDPVSYEPVKDVFVYDFTTRRWSKGKDMPQNRSFFAASELGGRVFIAGGHDENKNALSSAWVYDVRRDEWTELAPLSQERDECEGVIIGSEFVVVSGYRTDNQGGFEESAESYDLGSAKWKRIEHAWKASQCPKSSVGVVKDGKNQWKMFCWAESNSEVRVGVCGIQLGRRTFFSGSAYQGGPQGFFLAEEGQSGRPERIDVPEEFAGLVQSGCHVEI